jgi:hypothetical protein
VKGVFGTSPTPTWVCTQGGNGFFSGSSCVVAQVCKDSERGWTSSCVARGLARKSVSTAVVKVGGSMLVTHPCVALATTTDHSRETRLSLGTSTRAEAAG